jgi:hypothetical protein
MKARGHKRYDESGFRASEVFIEEIKKDIDEILDYNWDRPNVAI